MKRPDLSELNKRRSEEFRAIQATIPHKECPACHEVKLRTEFNRQSKTYDGRQGICRACANHCGRIRMRKLNSSLREQVFDKLGRKCSRCNFPDVRALQIDHVNGGGRVDNDSHRGVRFYRKVLSDTSGSYQILCANCNWIKRHENSELPRRIQ